MSPLWRDRLGVALCPDRVSVVHRRRGWRSVAGEPWRLNVPLVDGHAGWQAPLATFAQWLAEHSHAGAELEVVLADAFVRYTLIPWADAGRRAEEQDLAGACFSALYDENMDAWDLRLDDGAYGKPRLACAVAPGLLAKVVGVCAEHKLKLRSVQPRFVRAVNRWLRDLDVPDALLLVIGGDQTVCATRRDNGWIAVRAVALGRPSAQQVGALIQREKLLQGLVPEATVFVHCDEAGVVESLRQTSGVVVLGPLAAAGGGALELALR